MTSSHRAARRLSIIASIVGALLGPATGHGTVLARRTLAELSSAADLVVVARVQSRASLLVRGRVYTDAQLAVGSVVRGRARSSTIVVRTPGGVAGGIGQHLAGSPDLRPGTRYVLFLRARGATYETLGLAQGALPIADDANETVHPADTTGLEWSNGSVAPGVPAGGIALRELLQRL